MKHVLTNVMGQKNSSLPCSSFTFYTCTWFQTRQIASRVLPSGVCDHAKLNTPLKYLADFRL